MGAEEAVGTGTGMDGGVRTSTESRVMVEPAFWQRSRRASRWLTVCARRTSGAYPSAAPRHTVVVLCVRLRNWMR